MRPNDLQMLRSIDYTKIPKITPDMGDLQKTLLILNASTLSRLFHDGFIIWEVCPRTMREGFVLSGKGKAILTVSEEA